MSVLHGVDGFKADEIKKLFDMSDRDGWEVLTKWLKLRRIDSALAAMEAPEAVLFFSGQAELCADMGNMSETLQEDLDAAIAELKEKETE